jgi:hypothetical protein
MLDKGGLVQGLGEQVGWLLKRVNGQHLNATRLDPLTEVMVLLVNVPCPWAHFRNLCQVDGASIVLKQTTENSRRHLCQRDSKRLHLSQQVHHNDGNAQRLRQSNILGLSS